jgi:hypothetical protein
VFVHDESGANRKRKRSRNRTRAQAIARAFIAFDAVYAVRLEERRAGGPLTPRPISVRSRRVIDVPTNYTEAGRWWKQHRPRPSSIVDIHYAAQFSTWFVQFPSEVIWWYRAGLPILVSIKALWPIIEPLVQR